LGREGKPVKERVVSAANALAEAVDADVLLYTGDIDRPYDDKLLDQLMAFQRRKNVILILCTFGGDPDAAYRIARGLQENYSRFVVVLAGHCKSAGTLLVVGAHEIAMTQHAELGPLDVQVGKKDELVGLDSGLTVLDALGQLEGKAFELFENAMLKILGSSGGRVTFKTATHIATELSKGIVAPIMAQIDPMHVGEVSRALKIGEEYAKRLSDTSDNLQAGALKRLVHGYPSHGFVIDKREAQELFNHVRDVSPEESALLRLLKGDARFPQEDPVLSTLSEPRKEAANDGNNTQDPAPGGADTAPRVAPTEGFPAGEEPAGDGTVAEFRREPRTGTD
jgi:hypothetical protein